MVRPRTPSRRPLLVALGCAIIAAGAGAPAVRAAEPVIPAPVSGDPGDPGEPVTSANADAPGFIPSLEPPAFSLGGYIDVGFADADGDGTSFHPDDHRLPADYAVDPFMTAVNSRGDVASTASGGHLTNGFLPRSAGLGGKPSFLINTLALDVRRGAPGDALLVFARVQLVPRLDRDGSQTHVFVEQAFGRVQPFDAHELMLFVGKFDSVFGIEYLENQANLRVGVTPSLLARYTTGTSIGAKLLYRLPLEQLASVASLNLAATNSAPFIEVLQAPDVSLTGRPALSARIGYELNLPGLQIKAGGSALRAARNDQGDPDTLVRGYGADLRIHLPALSLTGEYVRVDEDRGIAADKLTGAGMQILPSGFHVRGFWGELDATLPAGSEVFRRTIVYVRGEQRRGWFEGFAQILVRRFTLGVRLDLGDSVALKLETLLNREYEGAPNVDNDVRTASLVWSF